MKIKAKKDYEPCPEYQGVAVCVDVTDPEERETDYGIKESIRFIFQIPLEMKDGRRWSIRSAPLNTTLSPRGALRKFLKQMLGRDLNGSEQKEFETEELVGKCFDISVIHEESEDGRIFDQIALCRPWKGEKIEPSSDYVRVRDRKEGKGRRRSEKDDDDGDGGEGSSEPSKESTFRRAEQVSKTKDPSDHGLIKVHVGKHKGLELRDLTREAIEKLIEGWLTKVYPEIEKPLADDRRLAAALEAYRKKFSGEPDEEDPDDVPY
jgi:hypothetical protein